MTDTDTPVLNESTMRDLRLYEFVPEDDEDEMTHIALWAVHGEGDNVVEYPILTYSECAINRASADPRFGTMPGRILGDPFYEFFAGQAARLVTEGAHVLDDLFAFTPDEFEGNEAFIVRELLQGFVLDERAFEVEWALERGMKSLEASINAADVSDVVTEDMDD